MTSSRMPQSPVCAVVCFVLYFQNFRLSHTTVSSKPFPHLKNPENICSEIPRRSPSSGIQLYNRSILQIVLYAFFFFIISKRMLMCEPEHPGENPYKYPANMVTPLKRPTQTYMYQAARSTTPFGHPHSNITHTGIISSCPLEEQSSPE